MKETCFVLSIVVLGFVAGCVFSHKIHEDAEERQQATLVGLLQVQAKLKSLVNDVDNYVQSQDSGQRFNKELFHAAKR